MNERVGIVAVSLIIGVLASLAVALPPAQPASAQCADPRGNAYCGAQGGQVTFPTPQPQPAQRSGPCANPSGCAPGSTGLVTFPTPQPARQQPVQPQPVQQASTQNPNAGKSTASNPNPGQANAPQSGAGPSSAQAPAAPPLVDVQNPDAGLVNVANPDAGLADVQNPDAGAGSADAMNPNAANTDTGDPNAGSADSTASPPQVQAQAPNVPASTVTQGGATVTVSPAEAAAGGMVVVTAQGLNPRGRVNPSIFVNLAAPGGAISLLPANGTGVRLGTDGSLAVSFALPAGLPSGPQRVCIAGETGVAGGAVCAPFTVSGDDQAGAPAATQPVTGTATGADGSTYCSSCQLLRAVDNVFKFGGR